MAQRSVSPGAALLRSSRMFSMPAPIPPPPGDYSSATKHYSPTATINYPTHLSVTTPSSSRIVGDWGFKRPFPLKTTLKTTYPLVRVRQVDSTEHVTDFQSSSDHTITLQKFQELNMPISVPPEHADDKYKQAQTPVSVFEEEGDVTAIDSQMAVDLENKRWKFKGPWLAGLTDGQFNEYLEKTVRTRRPEFRAYLKGLLAKEMTEDQGRVAREAGETAPAAVNAGDVTETQLVGYLRRLRTDRMELFRLVGRFLDLAPIAGDLKLRHLGSLEPNKATHLTRASPYGATGPPITHPSAGLSYLRTRNFGDNHPVYGPQKHHPPVKTRVLMPRSSGTGNFDVVLGIAGFVAETPYGDLTFNIKTIKGRNQTDMGRALHSLELEKYGGGKVYGRPTATTIDSNGRVRINVTDASKESETIHKEMLGEEGGEVYEKALKSNEPPEVPLNPRGHMRQRRSPLLQGSSESYGWTL